MRTSSSPVALTFLLSVFPSVSGVEVDVLVEEITRDAKVLVLKERKRKQSRRLNGFPEGGYHATSCGYSTSG
jgi:hypothetical protein